MTDISNRREVFFGLIAPIGIDLNAVNTAIATALKLVNYDQNIIRFTEIFSELPDDMFDLEFSEKFERYIKYIKAGDELCEKTESRDIFARYGIHKLKQAHDRKFEHPLPTNVAHVFRQIKRIEEVLLFKQVFGRNILFLGCYSPKAQRVQFLVNQLLQSQRGRNRSELEAKALEIISIDEDERDKPSGQRVVECFPHADFVIDCSTQKSLNESVERLVKIFFGYPFISPSRDEYASYIANAASYRSLDLSRQVGAAIFTKSSEIVSLGCNEVPASGGGTYWEGNEHDGRDFAQGHDSNQKIKSDMARDALSRLSDKGWLTHHYSDMETDKQLFHAFEKKNAPLKNAMINDVIEYGRMVHAEMNAITDAARAGKSTKDCTLYCTTMPCHLCTKLVIAAGINRVVYVQPYSKSLVEEMYQDSVCIDNRDANGRVSFETLKGVTPNGFRIAFRKSKKRKDLGGDAVQWEPFSATPIFTSHFAYYVPLEAEVTDSLIRILQEKLNIIVS